MSETADTITFDQMKGAIGSLLFLWCDIERSVRAALQTDLFTGNPKSVHKISRALDVWAERVMQAGSDRPLQTEICQRLSGLLKDALVVRNLVCHGLTGYSAQDPHGSYEAHLCVALDGVQRVVTWSELQAMFRWMSRSRWLIGTLTWAAMEEDATTSEERLRGWKRFPEQF